MPINRIYHSSPDYPVLTGRELRRETLLNFVTEHWRNGKQILGFYGAPGIGKTTAAVQSISVIQDSINYVLWLELRVCPNAGGLLSQLYDCIEEIGKIAVAQQLRQQIQPDPSYLSNILLENLGRDCLLIIDHCEILFNEPENSYLSRLINVLLSKTGWRSLFTIRAIQTPRLKILDNLQIIWYPVEKLTHDERKALINLTLSNNAKRWDNLSQENKQIIINEFAGYPFFVRLLFNETEINLNETINHIRNLSKNNNEYAVLDYFIGLISPLARPMLELLAAIEDREPLPFVEGAWHTLGNVLGLPTRQYAGIALSELQKLALIEEGNGGYRISPVVRQYLSERSHPLGFPERHAQLFYFHLFRLYEALAKQVKGQAQTLLAIKNDANAAQQAAGLIRYHAVLRDRALRQAFHINNLDLSRRALEGLIDLVPWRLTSQFSADRCLAYAQRLDDCTALAIKNLDNTQTLEVGACYHTIGRVYEEIQANELALATYQRALNWWEQARQSHRLGETWLQIGMLHTNSRNWSAALAAYRTALDWWERTRQHPQMGKTWRLIGKLYYEQGSWTEALTAYHTAIDWQKRTNRTNELSRIWHGIGESYESQREFNLAAQAYVQALEWLRANNDDSDQNFLEIILAAARHLLTTSTKIVEEQFSHLQKAVSLFEQNKVIV